MKILQIVHSLGTGGAEKFVVELSNELAKNNEVILCSVKKIEDWMVPAKNIRGNVKTTIMGFNKKYSLTLLYKLYIRIKQNKPDVVQIHSSILVFYFFILSIFFSKIIFIQTIHSTLTPAYKKLFFFLSLFSFFHKRFINICISKHILNAFVHSFPKLNFVNIDNGITGIKTTSKLKDVQSEINSYKKIEMTKVFLAVGNYSDFKNFRMLVNVLKELEVKKIDVILLIIGGGSPISNKNYKEVTLLKADNTYQLGLKDNVPDYLDCSDALIISSIKEGMPLVALEALSAGLPIISTPAGGMKDLISDKINGFLSDNFSGESLLQKIEEFLLLRNDEIQRIKEANKKMFAENYSIHMCTGNYYKLYSSTYE